MNDRCGEKRTFKTLAAGPYDDRRTERPLSRPPKPTASRAMAHQFSTTWLTARFGGHLAKPAQTAAIPKTTL